MWGNTHIVDDTVRHALLASMNLPADTPEALHQALQTQQKATVGRWLEPVMVIPESDGSVDIAIHLPSPIAGRTYQWQLRTESGDVWEGHFSASDLRHVEDVILSDYENRIGCYRLHLDNLPGEGYHRFILSSTGLDTNPHSETDASHHAATNGKSHKADTDSQPTSVDMLLVVTPSRCFLPVILDEHDARFHGDEDPETAAQSARVWGPAVQLYAVNSKRNWGIGDYSDLLKMVDWCAEKGASLVGLNPLHALFQHNPAHTSPYSPSSRMYFNVLLLDPESIDDFPESDEARQLALSPEYQEAFRRMRGEALIDYPEVGKLKSRVLELLYQSFRTRHRVTHSERSHAFDRFIHEQGRLLEQFALYHALQDHFHAEDASIWGWPVWPEAYQQPGSEAVQEFLQKNAERVEYYQYLQWQIDQQLSKVGKRCMEKNLGIGIYMDLAVGVDRGGADVWVNQHLYAQTSGVGAPPDEYNLLGQDWGLPPLIPQKMKEEQYQSFIDMLRQNMRHSGALRIDHVMAIMRLFWIPPGLTPAQGAYVHYPVNDLFGILALESQRNRCMVIGEDMGTVPELVRECMQRWGVYSYKAFYFEKASDDKFKLPEQYQDTAAVAVSTHDLPTLSGFWQGQDISTRTELDLYPTRELAERQVRDRVMDRMSILRLLDQRGLLPAGVTTDPHTAPIMTPELATAIHRLVAQTRSKVMMVQFEDMLQQIDPINLPGTSEPVYPCWRRRLTVPVEDLFTDARVDDIARAIGEERPLRAWSETPQETTSVMPPIASVPRATYRFQFNKDFTLRQATALIPYLHQLGISHCYASPLLKAREGSLHGYDITDHHRLNPEIGTVEEFEHFAKELRKNHMALLLDIVPNHMGASQNNPWWMDVLENGPASLYSDYFDIDWHPLTHDLQNKILLPILGSAYGNVLENGELQLRFDEETGRLWLDYYDNTVPINPSSYPVVLRHRLEVLEARLGKASTALLEYQSIILSFENLPKALSGDTAEKEIRIRERQVALGRLMALIKQSSEIGNFIAETLRDFQSKGEDSTNLLRLNRLMEQQSYRLSNWRVASDEINYRRFFDVNDLVGVRVEDRRVFNDTHALIMDFIEKGYVQGLRIDHPDGLNDPAGYFRSLQEEAARRLPSEAAAPESWKLCSPTLPLYVLIEKILAPFERLPDEWPVHGTSGYEFVNAVNGVLVNQKSEADFTPLYESIIDRDTDFDELVYYSKKLIMKTTLNGELSGLSSRLSQLCKYNWSTRDFTLYNLRSALMEVVAAFPVYRTYVTRTGDISKKDREYIEWAIRLAKRRNPVTDPSIFDFIQSVLLLTFKPEGYLLQDNPTLAEEIIANGLPALSTEEAPTAFQALLVCFVLKFQQYTGPVMAKGLEDTSFYRYNRLVSLNEVGGEPKQFGLSPLAFHHQNLERLKRTPHTLLASSTHDTKRSEDTRARISVLSEMPEAWSRHVLRWFTFNRQRRLEMEDQAFAPSLNAEYLFYQTMVGIWPFSASDETKPSESKPDEATLNTLADRLETYMLKAEREAKLHTSWINPNQAYEDGMAQFIRQVVTRPSDLFMEDFLSLQKRVARFGLYNALSQTLLKLTAPGVPDLYQGTELWDFSLVDPDNRRPVDYALRREILDDVQALLKNRDRDQDKNKDKDKEITTPGSSFTDALQALTDNLEDGRIKAYTIAAVLAYRAAHPDVFSQGSYIPLEVTGSAAENILAFARFWEDEVAIVVAPRLLCSLLYAKDLHCNVLPCGRNVWEDTAIIVPDSLDLQSLTGVLDGQKIELTTANLASGDAVVSVATVLAHLPIAFLRGHSHSSAFGFEGEVKMR